MMNVTCASLLGLGLLVACGGSASRDRNDARPPSAVGGAADEPPDGDARTGGTGTGGTMSAGAASAAGRASGTSGTNASVGGYPDALGGRDGMDSAGAAPTLPLPTGCEPRARMETADVCSLAVYCDTASQLTNCRRLASGRWECKCETYNRDRIYQLENAPGLEACALTARLCSESEDGLQLGEESCETVNESLAPDSCNIDLACSRQIGLDLAADAQAWLMRFGSARCHLAESGKSFECGCYGKMPSEYDVLADSGEVICRPLVDFCMSGATPSFEGEEHCWLTNEFSSSDGCEREEMCAVPMPLNGDVSLAKGGPRYANCAPRQGGGAECYCSGIDSSFNFQLPDALDDASCSSAILNCDDDSVIAATGAASCQPSSVTAMPDSCQADLSCVQDALIDGREIVGEGRLLVTCARVEPGMPWWCSCASDQTTARFQLGAADSSSWQACNQAPAGCLEQLALHLGPYGELVLPPDPLESL